MKKCETIKFFNVSTIHESWSKMFNFAKPNRWSWCNTWFLGCYNSSHSPRPSSSRPSLKVRCKMQTQPLSKVQAHSPSLFQIHSHATTPLSNLLSPQPHPTLTHRFSTGLPRVGWLVGVWGWLLAGEEMSHWTPNRHPTLPGVPVWCWSLDGVELVRLYSPLPGQVTSAGPAWVRLP